jgi:putative ABC transport system permease protein
MTLYYLKLALISLRKDVLHTTIMVMAIGLGVGVCMSIVTVNYLMAKNPIPHKSDQLFYVQLDNWDPNRAARSPDKPPEQVTWQDTNNLIASDIPQRQTRNARFSMVIQPDDPEIRPFQVDARAAHGDFFAMFDVPFLFGGAWSKEADGEQMFSGQQVVVLSRKINDRVFGGEDPVGRDIQLAGELFRVVGVVDEWLPVPKFYDLTNNPFGDPSDVFVPFNMPYQLVAGLDRMGNTNCWKPTGGAFRALMGSECVWIQFWVELPGEADRQAYIQYLNDYVSEQKETGRFPRPVNNKLSNVAQWLDENEIVQPEAKMMLAVAVMFLCVCLLNTIGLLLSKFLGKSAEVGVRRALGASRNTLFFQYLIETSLIGVTGGVLALLLTWFGLEAMLALFGSDAENLMRLDMTLVAYAIILAIISSIAAGLYPTWRACNIPPAIQLKSQ